MAVRSTCGTLKPEERTITLTSAVSSPARNPSMMRSRSLLAVSPSTISALTPRAQRVADEAGMGDADAVDQPRPALALIDGDLVAGELDRIVADRRGLELLGDVFPAALADAGHVDGLGRRLRRQRRQPAVADPFGDRVLVHYVVTQVAVALAQVAAVEAERRRGQTRHAELGRDLTQAVERRVVHPLITMREQMALIDDDQVTRAEGLRIPIY